MRVVWKDSRAEKTFNSLKYRKHFVYGSSQGWTTDLPGDENLYKSHYCAFNAIDAYFGDYGMRGTEKRKACGIEIVGKKKTS